MPKSLLVNALRRCVRLRLRRSSSGQSLAEFALALPVLLMVMFGIFEFGRFYYTSLTLQHAVREAARFAVTGATLNDPETGEPMDRASSITQVVVNKTAGLGVDLEQISINPSDGGDPEEIVRVGVTFRYEFALPLIPGGSVDLSYVTAMRNEPYHE